MSFRTLQPSSASFSPPPSSDSAVQVAVRIRPLNPREAGLHAQPLCRRHPGLPSTVLLEPPIHRTNRRSLSPLYADNGSTEAQTFGYDFVYDDNELHVDDYQQRVFDDIGLQILDNAISGYNVSLLAYGQTSSGKTYSMMGHADSHGASAGLIPRVCSALFEHINTAPTVSATGDKLLRKVECSYLEIYSEKIRDLLDPTHRNLRIRENPKTGPYVDGLSVCAVSSYDELAALMSAGNAERTIASTNMNAESSRSHAVFTVIYTQTTVDETTKLSSDVVSKVQLVDLAGSERVEQSGASGVRLREASQINKSLTTLGRVVQALAQRSEEREKSNGGGGGPAHRHSVLIGGTMTGPLRKPRGSVLSKSDDVFIPFRDSVLTWLLKESLGGNSRTIMLACVSPADSNWEETVSTLRYASRAKSIVNTARINEDPNAQLIRTLKAEIDTLRSQLAQSATSTTTTSSSLPPPVDSPSSASLTFTYSATERSPNTTLREKDSELLQMNAHIARLQAQLTASSVSMLEREAAWEARLQEARELEARRMKDMEGRGVSVRRDERELPFLVNLNEDPALSESLIYYVADGTTTVGSRKRRRRTAQAEQADGMEGTEGGAVKQSSGASEERMEAEESDDEDGGQDMERRIILSGIHVKEDHCTLTKHAHGVIIAPIPGVQAETHVNGELLAEERLLMHGDRVVIGGQHYFRFSRSKAAIETDRAREEERRRKKKEDMKARISIDTNNHLAPTSPSGPPSASPIPDEGVYDFEFAQRELIVGGGAGDGGGDGAARAAGALNASRGGATGAGNRSMNRSAYEDIEPDSSPDPPQRPARSVSATTSSLPSARTADGATITLEQLQTPSKSPTSPASVTSAADSSSPSAARANGREEKEKEDEGAELQVPKFHLGRDVKGSIDWSSRRALTKGEIDEWIRHDRRYLAKHQQRLIDRQHAACVSLMQPLQHYAAHEFKVASHALYRWRWHVIKAALREEIMRLVFLCDEANAICSALGRPERYKVELASSHNVLPEVFLSLHPRSQLSQPQCSPLQRLRQLKVVFCQVVEVRRRMLPLPVLSFDLLTFQEQLAVLREHYNDMLEGQDDGHNKTITPSASSSVSLSSLSSPASAAAPSLLTLPSTQLYSHPQLLGRAFCFLHALRYGHSVKHNAVVLDERGEQAGVLTVEIELASVDEDVARKEIAAEEKLRGKDDRDDEGGRAVNQSQLEADEDVDTSNENDASLSPSAQSDDEQKNVNTFMSAHRVLALIVRILSYDTQTRQLRRCGLQSVWVKYHVKDSTAAYRGKKLTVRDDTSRYAVDMERSHYFSGMDLQGLTDWLEFDCLVFELWCMVDDSSRASQASLTSPLSPDTLQSQNGNRPRNSLSPSPSTLSGDDGLLQNEDDEASIAVDHERRQSLANRMQSPLNRSASRDTTPQKRETEKSLHSRAPSHLTPAHHRRSTFGSSSVLAPVKSVEDERVEIENGQKVVDHLLFCAVDVEEETSGGAVAASKAGGGFVGCSLKEEGTDGQMIFRVGLHRDHRLVISLLQVDQRPFVLESLSSVTVTALSLSTGSSRYSPPLSAPITVPIVEQFAHVDHKLLVCTTGWPRALEDHTFFSHASAAGERITLSLRLECFFSRTTAPVLVNVDTQMKVYKGGSLDKPSLFSKKAGVSESERLARIGLHVSVTRQSSPQTVGNVVREHELVLEQLQRRLRFEHRRQHHQLINKLRSTQPHLVAEVDQRHLHGADGLTRHFTLRFSRILADLRRRGGIQVAVERVSADSGVKCSYLNERRKPAAPFEPKWAVLRPPYLFLYNRRGERKEQSIVRLMKADYVKGDVSAVGTSAAGGNAPFVWSIKTTAGAVCILQAANEGEMKSWLRALGANLVALGMLE